MNKNKFILRLAISIALVFTFSCSSGDDTGGGNSGGGGGTDTFKDIRDNRSYKFVKIGEQTWMAENLNYNATGSKCGDESTRTLSDENTTTCDTYGRLYNFATAKIACPAGWDLPTKADWEILIITAGGEATGGKYLRISGFKALAGGWGRPTGEFKNIGEAGFWRSTASGLILVIPNGGDKVAWNSDGDEYLHSVRCIKK